MKNCSFSLVCQTFKIYVYNMKIAPYPICYKFSLFYPPFSVFWSMVKSLLSRSPKWHYRVVDLGMAKKTWIQESNPIQSFEDWQKFILRSMKFVPGFRISIIFKVKMQNFILKYLFVNRTNHHSYLCRNCLCDQKHYIKAQNIKRFYH